MDIENDETGYVEIGFVKILLILSVMVEFEATPEEENILGKVTIYIDPVSTPVHEVELGVAALEVDAKHILVTLLICVVTPYGIPSVIYPLVGIGLLFWKLTV